MKRILAIVMALALVLVLAACGGSGAMSHKDYMDAALDTEVTVETYVQAKQSWEDGQVTLYTQAKDGAYFVYGAACSEADYEKLTPGTKILVKGFKSEWSGEIEIVDATFEIKRGSYVAEPLDVTAMLGTEDLAQHMNEKVAFKGMIVEAANEAGDAFMYNWDGSGQEGDDLYFNVSVNGVTYSFTVESSLCGPDTEVYQNVKNLKVGDKIDLEGFLYWYEGANPHITAVTPVA